MTPHQKRRCPEKVDFRTSAGFLSGRAEREAARLRGAGPAAVVTDLGILEPDASGELVLAALHPGAEGPRGGQNTGWARRPAPPPGVEASRAEQNTGWPLRQAPSLRVTEPIRDEELRILRDLDPDRIYLE